MNKTFYQLLRKSQKYTGTDNVYLFKGGFWLTLGHAISLGSSFLLAIAFANLLDPVVYGNYKYALSLFGMLEIFSLVGMKTAISQAVARGLEGSFYTGFKTQLKFGFFGSLAAVAGAAYYWIRGNEILPIPLLLAAVFLPLMYASRVYLSFLEGKKLFDVQTTYSTINQVFFVAVIICALFFTKNPFWLIAVYLIAHTLSNYALYIITELKYRPNKNKDPETISYGFHISLMGVISQSATYLDKILIFTFIGAGELAVYSFASIFPEQIQNILGKISTLAMPKLAPKSHEEIRTNIMKKVWQLSLVTVVVIVFFVVLAPFLYKIFFPQYLASIRYSQALIFSLISFPATLLGTAFQAKMMKKELYLIKIAPFINIILLAILVPFYGVWGAIISIIGSQTFKLGLILFLFRKF
ncbi:MAG: oligosaccharide flippase family protein [Candidatus Nealsonbacteria bacterium]